MASLFSHYPQQFDMWQDKARPDKTRQDQTVCISVMNIAVMLLMITWP